MALSCIQSLLSFVLHLSFYLPSSSFLPLPSLPVTHLFPYLTSFYPFLCFPFPPSPCIFSLSLRPIASIRTPIPIFSFFSPYVVICTCLVHGSYLSALFASRLSFIFSPLSFLPFFLYPFARSQAFSISHTWPPYSLVRSSHFFRPLCPLPPFLFSIILPIRDDSSLRHVAIRCGAPPPG